MEKVISFDKQGRLYIPEELKNYLRVRTVLVKNFNNGLYIEPIEEDPLEALSKLGKGKFKGKSIQQLKKEAREEIEDHAAKKIRRH